MDDILRSLNERIEEARCRLNKAKSVDEIIAVSREVDDLVNLYTRLSRPGRFTVPTAGRRFSPVRRGAGPKTRSAPARRDGPQPPVVPGQESDD
ncbi:MAG: aspartyl-phosphate phosphatase Spo0E family protein [Peptococcaceae bacterium]|jgi:hypothetical protein|nr:aspartyl-phosphate phosphatase Spo0E family protein [Peptococcaceae bacterium]